MQNYFIVHNACNDVHNRFCPFGLGRVRTSEVWIGQVSCSIIVIVCSGSVSQTPPSTHSDSPGPRVVDLSDIPDDGPLGELESTIVRFSILLCLGGRSQGAYGSHVVYVCICLSVGRIS